MPASKIHLFPDPILRKKSETIKLFGAALRPTLKNLAQAMDGKPHAIGIAAPQIGISRRIAIVDVSARVPGAGRILLINPEILDAREERLSREGCMSLPDYRGDIKRYKHVMLEWKDVTGKQCRHAFEGIEAICIQHEVDHLNGLLFIDHVASLKRDLIPRT